jgi:hypothetical protein
MSEWMMDINESRNCIEIMDGDWEYDMNEYYMYVRGDVDTHEGVNSLSGM